MILRFLNLATESPVNNAAAAATSVIGMGYLSHREEMKPPGFDEGPVDPGEAVRVMLAKGPLVLQLSAGSPASTLKMYTAPRNRPLAT